jgi:antirestriction protein ArdC
LTSHLQFTAQTRRAHARRLKSEKRTPYDIVTDRIIRALEAGVVPWRKPWRGRSHLPCNAISKRPYHGINLLLLSLTPYTDHRWLTLRQANELGGRVRQGEHASIAVFWKRLEVEKEDDRQKPQKVAIPLLRYYQVFNAEQCQGLDLPVLMDDWNVELKARIESAEQVIQQMPNAPKIVEGGSMACYLPPQDLVRIPKIQDFESPEAYYSTLFHELGHSTGHETRLNRPGVTGKVVFGSCDYSREELIAELTSAFVCAEVGIDNSIMDNAASYIHGWLHALEGDPRAVIAASGQAQRAANYIQGKMVSEEPSEPAFQESEAVAP